MFTRVIFTDRRMGKPIGKMYTYRTPDFKVKTGDLVVVQSGDGYSIGQVVGKTDTIDFPKELLKDIVVVIPNV